MAFNIREFFKGLRISEENTNQPKQIEITPGGTANTKTSITSSQTVNRDIILPDDTTTLLGTATTQNVSNKTITTSTIDSTPIGQTTPAAVATTSLVATTADINAGTIDNTTIGATTPSTGVFTNLVATSVDINAGTIDNTVIGDAVPAAGTFTNLTANSANIGGSTVVTENSVQTLKNKSLEDTTTAITDSIDPTIKIMFNAAGTTATKTTLLGSQTVDRTLTLPNATDTLVARNTVETLTNKTLTAPVMSNATITGGTIDNAAIGQTTPAAADFTTVDTTGNVNVGGSVVITGDLTVNGTTTTINTQTLDVEDSNITVNFGGSDASAEGAGLTVDRTGTSGSLIYKDASATKFAAGALGSEVDLVGTTTTQNLTNKSLQDSTTSIVDAVDPTKQIKFDAAGTTGTSTTLLSSQTTNKILTLPDATDTLVGKDTTDILTNKTLQFLQQTVATNAALTGADQTLNTITTGVVRLTNASLASLAGITAGASGQTIMIENKTGNSVNIFNDSASASASDRILTGTSTTVEMKADATLIFVYDSTSSRWHLAGGSGSGTGSGGVNFIPTGNAESTNPFEGYLYGATAKPVGTPLVGAAGITATISSTNPLAEDNSFLLTKTVTDATQGSSLEIPFTVDPAYRAKANTIEFDYILNSGTFQIGTPTQNSDFIVYIRDLDTGNFIEPSNFKLLSNSTTTSSKFSAQFQTSATSVNYTLMFYFSTANTSQFSLKVDNIKVGPSQYVYGSPVTDWQSYTPTVSGFGTISNGNFKWRRNGDTIELEGGFTTGTVQASTATVTLPTGYTISSDQYVGYKVSGIFNTATVDIPGQTLTRPDVNNGVIFFGYSGSGVNNASAQNGNAIANSSAAFTFKASVRVNGLSSSVQMSDNADTRVVAAEALATAQTISSVTNTLINLTSSTVDTHGMVDIATDRINILVAGTYEIEGIVNWNGTGTGSYFAQIAINGSIVSEQTNYLNYVGTSNFSVVATRLANLKAGDYVSLYGRQNSGANKDTIGTYTKLSVVRISGPSAIAANELVSVVANNASAQSFTSGAAPATITGWTEIKDSHGSFDPSTGIFTVPVSGVYDISVSPTFSNTAAAGDRAVDIFLNNTTIIAQNLQQNIASSGSGQSTQPLRVEYPLLAGETIRVRASQASGSSQTLVGVGYRTTLSISRKGF